MWLTQQTLGKALAGITLIRVGKAPGLWWSLGRASLGYFIVDLSGLGLVVSLFDRHRRCIHDHVFASRAVIDLDLDEGGALRPRLLARLVRYAEKHQTALDEKERPYRQVKGFWEFQLRLAAWPPGC